MAQAPVPQAMVSPEPRSHTRGVQVAGIHLVYDLKVDTAGGIWGVLPPKGLCCAGEFPYRLIDVRHGMGIPHGNEGQIEPKIPRVDGVFEHRPATATH